MSEVKTYRVEFVEDRFSKWMSKDDHDAVVAELLAIKSFVMSSASSSQDDAEVVLLSEHKSAMKIQSQDLKSRWNNQVHDLEKTIAEKDESYDKLDNVNMKLNETIEANVRHIDFLTDEIATERKTIAELKAFKVAAIAENQELKRVVEKLKRYTQHRVDCICRAGVLEYANDCDCGLDAIAKGEE